MLQLLGGAQRLSYRRLLAFLVGTALLWWAKIDQNAWEMVTIVFIGAELTEKYLNRPVAGSSAVGAKQADVNQAPLNPTTPV